MTRLATRLRDPWPTAYGLALSVSIATFFLRQALSVSFGERPLLIQFVFPRNGTTR